MKKIEWQLEQKKWEQLKWEYLKRSKKYKKYCEQRRVRGFTSNPEDKEFEDDIMTLPGKTCRNALHYNPKQKVNIFNPLFSKYGDVHSRSFDEYWETRGKAVSRSYAFPNLVEDYSDFIGRDIDLTFRIFKERQGREPTIDELKTLLIESMKNFGDSVYLMVTRKEYNSHEMETIIGNIKHLLKVKGRLRDELNRYLKVYDIWLSCPDNWQEDVLHKLSPYKNHTGDELDIKRQIRRDLRKAKRIINNVEHDSFPGKYD
jgi:hypothetical protein